MFSLFMSFSIASQRRPDSAELLGMSHRGLVLAPADRGELAAHDGLGERIDYFGIGQRIAY